MRSLSPKSLARETSSPVWTEMVPRSRSPDGLSPYLTLEEQQKQTNQGEKVLLSYNFIVRKQSTHVLMARSGMRIIVLMKSFLALPSLE